METNYAWVVENGKQGKELRYRTFRNGVADWTAFHNEATRFARQIDAKRASQNGEEVCVQHGWDE